MLTNIGQNGADFHFGITKVHLHFSCFNLSYYFWYQHRWWYNTVTSIWQYMLKCINFTGLRTVVFWIENFILIALTRSKYVTCMLAPFFIKVFTYYLFNWPVVIIAHSAKSVSVVFCALGSHMQLKWICVSSHTDYALIWQCLAKSFSYFQPLICVEHFDYLNSPQLSCKSRNLQSYSILS